MKEEWRREERTEEARKELSEVGGKTEYEGEVEYQNRKKESWQDRECSQLDGKVCSE